MRTRFYISFRHYKNPDRHDATLTLIPGINCSVGDYMDFLDRLNLSTAGGQERILKDWMAAYLPDYYPAGHLDKLDFYRVTYNDGTDYGRQNTLYDKGEALRKSPDEVQSTGSGG